MSIHESSRTSINAHPPQEALLSGNAPSGTPDVLERAAITIQSVFRGHLARKSFLPLSPSECSRYRRIVQNLPSDTPRAKDGTIEVYYPRDAEDIVSKNLNSHEGRKRFKKTMKAQKILRAQGSKRVIIPRLKVFIHPKCSWAWKWTEERLKIDTNPYYNMGLYLSNLNLFDELARELTRFFSVAYLGHLCHDIAWKPLNNVVGDYVRYDNIPLLIQDIDGEPQGCVGFIDLVNFTTGPYDHFCNRRNQLRKEDQEIIDLARILPHHVDIIIDEANKQNKQFSEEDVRAASEKGIKYLHDGYTLYSEFLEKKGVTEDSLTLPIALNSEREQKLQEVIKTTILELNDADRASFSEYPKCMFSIRNFIQESDFGCLDSLARDISERLLLKTNDLIKKISDNQPLKSKWAVMEMRSPLVDLHIEKLLSIKQILSGCKELLLDFRKNHYNELAEILINEWMQELVKGGEIHHFSFTPASRCWLRF